MSQSGRTVGHFGWNSGAIAKSCTEIQTWIGSLVHDVTDQAALRLVRRRIFSKSQRAFKTVVLETINVHHNCCNQCSPDYYIDDSAPQYHIGQARQAQPLAVSQPLTLSCTLTLTLLRCSEIEYNFFVASNIPFGTSSTSMFAGMARHIESRS